LTHTHLAWRKSSLSGSGGGGCVEVAAEEGSVFVRNSRHISGPVLSFHHEEWEAFVAGVRDGEFELTALLTRPVPEQKGDTT
jgi:hypothetical protein